MRRFIAAGAAALLFSVAACSSTPTVHVTPAQLSQTASVALGALEAGADVYLAKDPTVPAQAKANIRIAERAAEAAIAAIDVNNPSYNLKTGARDAVEAISEVAAAIPPGVLPPQASAAITAFIVVADIAMESLPEPQKPTKKLALLRSVR